ncbi:MAG: GTPase ObgE [Akkermansiaceae bacterium]|nr:GTPase ObgE [Akkermansiaceae bacterium]
MFVDNIRIFARAGKGGNGLASFRREKFIPRGGPDGGDGGDGGSVILEVSTGVNDLRSYFYDPKLLATDGMPGMHARKHGKDGKTVIGKVPPGTIVYRSNAATMQEATWLEREGDGIELEQIADLTEPGERFVLCQGGKGGRGNWHFRTATNQAPIEFEYGTEAESGVFFFELRRIADAGLVGYPNAGKSTLLTAISNATPKVASYPFTTLQPIVGVVEFEDYSRCVVADIPGIIEGASNNRGLGHEFLRHIMRCRVLLFVVDMTGLEHDPVEAIQTLRKEIKLYSEELATRPWVILANKMDEEAAAENLAVLQQRFPKVEIIPIAAATGQGIPEFKERLKSILQED